MYPTNCAYCGKPMKTYATNKRGDLPTVYCSTACEANAKYERTHETPIQNDKKTH